MHYLISKYLWISWFYLFLVSDKESATNCIVVSLYVMSHFSLVSFKLVFSFQQFVYDVFIYLKNELQLIYNMVLVSGAQQSNLECIYIYVCVCVCARACMYVYVSGKEYIYIF